MASNSCPRCSPDVRTQVFHGIEGRPLEALRKALTVDAAALSRIGVTIRVPWWRRQVQRRVVPRRFRRWLQREALREADSFRALRRDTPASTTHSGSTDGIAR